MHEVCNLIGSALPCALFFITAKYNHRTDLSSYFYKLLKWFVWSNQWWANKLLCVNVYSSKLCLKNYKDLCYLNISYCMLLDTLVIAVSNMRVQFYTEGSYVHLYLILSDLTSSWCSSWCELCNSYLTSDTHSVSVPFCLLYVHTHTRVRFKGQ